MGRVALEQTVNRPVRYGQVDVSAFSDMIGSITIPVINNTDVNVFASDISESIYNCVRSCSSRNMAQSRPNSNIQSNSYHSRWDQLLHDPDDSRVWRALDWRGEFIDSNNSNNQGSPSDNEF